MKRNYKQWLTVMLGGLTLWCGSVRGADSETNAVPKSYLKAHAILLSATTNEMTLLMLCQNVSTVPITIMASDMHDSVNISLGSRLPLQGSEVSVHPWPRPPPRPENALVLLPGQYAGAEVQKHFSRLYTLEKVREGLVALDLRVRAAFPPASPTNKVPLRKIPIQTLVTLSTDEATKIPGVLQNLTNDPPSSVSLPPSPSSPQ